MNDVIAIDFGTSRTKVGYWNPGFTRPQLLRFYDDDPYLPSLFYLERGSERILWGHDAREMLEHDAAGVIDVLKRRLREPAVRANRRKMRPGELLAMLFSRLRERAGQEIATFSGAPRQVFFTIPALYGPPDERVLIEAAVTAGFARERIGLVPEPVAAARAWLTETGERCEQIVVLDCGGGTIDWAYLRHDDEGFRIVADCPPGGDRHVGGHDVDLELLNLLADALGEQGEAVQRERYVYLQRVRNLKERYCRGLPIFPLHVHGQSVTLDERAIEEVLEARFVQQVCDNLSRYMEKIKTVADTVPPVLLVGGSARTRGLREAVEQRCGCRTVWWERSEYATVLGAVPTPKPAAGEAAGRRRPSRLARTLEGHGETVTSVAFARDGRLLASGSGDNTVKLWDPANGIELRSLSGHGDCVFCVAFSPGGRWLASGSFDRTIRLWDMADGQVLHVLRGHTDQVIDVAFSPDGRRLASASADKTIKLWNVEGGGELQTLWAHQKDVMSVAFSPDGRRLASASTDKTIKLWDAQAGSELQTLQGHRDLVMSVAFSPDGHLLASASADQTVCLWELDKQTQARVLEGHEDQVLAVAFSPDGHWLASGSADNTLRLWEVASGRLLDTLSRTEYGVLAVVFSPDGRWLAAAGEDKVVSLWR